MSDHDRDSGLTCWSGLRNFNNTQPGDGHIAATSIANGKHAVIDAADIVQVEQLMHGIRFKVPNASGFEEFEIEGDPNALVANLNAAALLASARRSRRKPEQLELAVGRDASEIEKARLLHPALPNPKRSNARE
jgi:hypothetical protein